MDEVSKAVREAAVQALRGPTLADVHSEPATDSDGWPALLVTLVFREGTSELGGDQVVDAMLSVQQHLQRLGEERFPIIDFVTEDEWRADADPQS